MTDNDKYVNITWLKNTADDARRFEYRLYV